MVQLRGISVGELKGGTANAHIGKLSDVRYSILARPPRRRLAVSGYAQSKGAEGKRKQMAGEREIVQLGIPLIVGNVRRASTPFPRIDKTPTFDPRARGKFNFAAKVSQHELRVMTDGGEASSSVSIRIFV